MNCVAHCLIERGWDDIVRRHRQIIPTDIAPRRASDYYLTSHDFPVVLDLALFVGSMTQDGPLRASAALRSPAWAMTPHGRDPGAKVA